MNAKKYGALERKLLLSLEILRLQEEVAIIEKEIQENPLVIDKPKKGIRSVASFLRKEKADSVEKELEAAKNNLKTYSDLLASKDGLFIFPKEELKEALDSFFEKDNGARRLTMGLEVGLAEARKDYPVLLRADKSREAISEFLFTDKSVIGKMLEVYAYSLSYIKGEGGILQEQEKDKKLGYLFTGLGGGISLIAGWTGVGLIVGGALGLVGASFLLHSAYKKNLTSNPSQDLLLFSAFVVGNDIRKKRFGRRAIKEIKKAGRVSDVENYIHSLVYGITVYNFRFKEYNDEKAKNALILYLEMIDNLRSDAEYLAFVERANVNENIKKIEAANKATDLLKELILKDIEKKKLP